jgi:hypothetical protein
MESQTMEITPTCPIAPEESTARFYVDVLKQLDRAQVPYAVGGGYAMAHYTGIARNTKDLDLFIKPEDRDRTLTTLAAAGYKTEFFYPFWIAKALSGDAFVDLLYSSGNGVCVVDDLWFEHGVRSDVLGYQTLLVPAEEQLWSKAFVQDRDRFDGADVIHLILGRGRKFDWERLLWRFRTHEPVLLAHLLLFRYAYPTERDAVPDWVMQRLQDASADMPAPHAKVTRGPFLAQRSYGVPVRDWGFIDGRLQPHGPLTQEEIDQLPEM